MNGKPLRVIAGLDPAIHHLTEMDPRVKPAGDGRGEAAGPPRSWL